jgi:hypothetical protein
MVTSNGCPAGISATVSALVLRTSAKPAARSAVMTFASRGR